MTVSTPSAPTASPVPSTEPAGTIRMRLADIASKEHLAGDGNWLYKIPFEGGHAVLKIYFGNRNPLLHVKKTFGNLVITGRTSHMPRARCRQEIDCVRIWEKHGFRTFGIRPDVIFEDLPRGGYMLFNYVPGVHFKQYFPDESIPLEERLATWRRWLPEWHRRHRLAVELVEPRLIHENGDKKHVMLWEDDFVNFDFEICFRSRDIRDLVGREMLAYLRSLGSFGDEMYDRMMNEVMDVYPDKSLLMEAWIHAYRNRNPVVRFFRWLDRKVNAKQNDKKYSKYSVARDIKRRLDERAINV